jgi:hypothetical protein
MTIGPILTENDFRCTVVPCADDAGMELVVKCCAAEINQSDLGIPENVLGFRVGALKRGQRSLPSRDAYSPFRPSDNKHSIPKGYSRVSDRCGSS